MPRYKITIEYDGSPFVGWQVQDNGPSVQGEIARAIEDFCGEDVMPGGAGRTDAGVHATGQVAHIDLSKDWEPDTVRDALNYHLKPNPIAILQCEPVGDDFDARFSAQKRFYLYRIVIRRAPLALDRLRAWRINHDLDEAAMDRAAKALIGKHDFTTFRSVHCQSKSPVKTLDEITVTRRGTEIQIDVSARSFMHNQVRSMVGSLKCVGEGKWPVSQMQEALSACDRSACGPVAPAHGLYLTKVEY